MSYSCCTDDHAGRIFLNRLAYFYLIPVFDMGLAMAVGTLPATEWRIFRRASLPSCRRQRASCVAVLWIWKSRERKTFADSSRPSTERRKREAYVRGEGNPNPAVVTFTTEVACMAVNELL